VSFTLLNFSANLKLMYKVATPLPLRINLIGTPCLMLPMIQTSFVVPTSGEIP
jgi:hypothetical protein